MKNNEWYTPAKYVEAARTVMGRIDLDPASCALANQTVRASCYYTEENNGLMQPWYGRVWLNPPYGKTNQAAASNLEIFTRRLIEQYHLGNVIEAILLIPANTATSWFDLLWQFPICFPKTRIRFIQENGQPSNGISFGTCFVYMGTHKQRFAEVFSQFGHVTPASGTAKPVTRELWEVAG